MTILLNSELKKKVLKIFTNIDIGDEFEVMFNNYRPTNKLSIINFMPVMKYIKWRSLEENIQLQHIVSLDIMYNYSNRLNKYRVSINTLQSINNFLNLVSNRKKNIMFSILISKINNDLDKNISIIHKKRNNDDIIDINDFDIRFRKSQEAQVTKKEMDNLLSLSHLESDKIIFRFKQRLSFVIIDDINCKIVIDLTIVKTCSHINQLSKVPESYELEIDVIRKNKKLKAKYFDIVLNECIKIKSILEGSSKIISIQEKTDIIKQYKSLVFKNDNFMSKNLYSMQPVTAEVQHIIDKIPNKYSVTDKADGEKYVLFIKNNKLYLISNNLHIKSVDIKFEGYDDTILEGELLFLPDKQTYIFMSFDILFLKGEDIRNESNLKKRIKLMNDFIKKINPNIYIIKERKGSFSIKALVKHHEKEIMNFYDNLNNQITKNNKNNLLINPKYFAFPEGGDSSEIFALSYLIWNSCTKNTKIKCPYSLDGIIYTGLEQIYTNDKKNQKYPIYKFKPPSKNSIDIYIRFKKNKETGEYLKIYDNSLENNIKNKDYRIASLYVGDIQGNREIPVPFMRNNNNDEAYFPIIDGEVRDIHNNVVMDSTVIEVTYNNDPSIPHKYRWIIDRIRWDKTESVIKYNKKYGNFKTVAEKNWKSMTEAVTIDDLKILSNSETYDSHMKILRSRINTLVISSERKQDSYYQKITNLLKPMRDYHNWIKSTILYTYCFPQHITRVGKKKQMDVLDIGCGRGGDIMKMYHSRINKYVGIDVNYDSIYSATNGAISRYNNLKKKFPNFTDMTFILADAGSLLNVQDQEKSLGPMSEENKNTIKKIFTPKTKFNIVISHFVIHYLFENDLVLDNVMTNINNHIKKGGVIIYTLFDMAQVMNLLNGKDKYTSYYTNEEGQKTILFDIIKKFDSKDKNKTGLSIDVHMSWISEENKYITEYLVNYDFMVKTMKEKCNCQLIESNLFINLYHLNKDYFTNVIKHEENIKNKKWYEKVALFFDNLSGADKEGLVYSSLFRYYIFRKI